jgi:hypothetical protein
MIFGYAIMAEETTSENAGARRFALTSTDLINVHVVQGKAIHIEEKPIILDGENFPSLYQRRLKLVSLKFVRGGNSSIFKKVKSITFSGFTLLAPLQRGIDTRSPTLRLEGQAFFDSTLPSDAIDVLILIGEPEIAPIKGFMGYSASVESGIYKGQPVRAFLLEGADATLPEALLSLVGWQAKPTLSTAKNALEAPHPIVAIDALRIAARKEASDQVELLSQWLLHPGQPAGVKATAIELLGLAISQLPQGSKEANILIETASTGWEAERAYQIDAAYLRTFLSISGHIKKSNQIKRIEAIADDYQIKELSILARQLADSMQKRDGGMK